MRVDTLNMTSEERDSFIAAVEIMIDYGESCFITDKDFELYHQLIEERRQDNKNPVILTPHS